MAETVLDPFDYTATAELYIAQGRWNHSAIRYKRFEAAASAIRHAIEVLPDNQLAGAVLKVAEHRYNRRMIRELYDSNSYPLPRFDSRRNPE